MLPQLSKDEEISEISSSQMLLFQTQVISIMKIVFNDIVTFSPVSVYQWSERLENLFSRFKYSESILTTKDYEGANFEKCKIQWGQYVFAGDQNIKQASRILDYTIMGYLVQKKLIEYAGIDESLDTRELWMTVNDVIFHTNMSISEYINDVSHYWKDADGEILFDKLKNYSSFLKNRYDRVLMELIAFRGCQLFSVWVKCENVNTLNNLLSTLEKQLWEYGLDPVPITPESHFFLQKVLKDPEFQKGSKTFV